MLNVTKPQFYFMLIQSKLKLCLVWHSDVWEVIIIVAD